VNLPAAINDPLSKKRKLNGYDSRCSAYAVALAVLTEMKFPASDNTMLEYPEGYTPKREQP
jgi:hypothetical protein